jgi:hypothetical protein
LKGRQEAIEAAKEIVGSGITPTYIWTSNTERGYYYLLSLIMEFFVDIVILYQTQ